MSYPRPKVEVLKSWKEIYEERVNSTYYDYFVKRYDEFLTLVSLNCNGKASVELGCGTANVSKYVSENTSSYNLVAFDNCLEMLALAEKNLGNSKVELIKANLLHSFSIEKHLDFLSSDTIAHSHGVLEHFADEELSYIKLLVLCNFKNSFHYVPSKKYKTPSRGDERLMTKSQWNKLMKPKEIIEFNEGYDLILCF